MSRCSCRRTSAEACEDRKRSRYPPQRQVERLVRERFEPTWCRAPQFHEPRPSTCAKEMRTSLDRSEPRKHCACPAPPQRAIMAVGKNLDKDSGGPGGGHARGWCSAKTPALRSVGIFNRAEIAERDGELRNGMRARGLVYSREKPLWHRTIASQAHPKQANRFQHARTTPAARPTKPSMDLTLRPRR
jgi:hypothetical protein